MPFVNNFVLLEGFVAGDFKKIGENGPAVGQISVSKRVKDKDTKEYVTRYDYVDVKGWSPAREQMAGLTDGEKVLVRGSLDRESWKDKQTDKTIYKLVVLVDAIVSIPKTEKEETSKSQQSSQDWDF